jgi:uncharacterized membrane-anchored protein YjiN (DUF445 family)
MTTISNERLSTMRSVATGLLLAMAALFVATYWVGTAHVAIGFVRAFAEAAMVGALADWFAITALFRRPLGLPIPHTAIIPRNKERIGENLASFVERNFLSPQVVAEKLSRVDFAGAFLEWMTQPGRAQEISARIAMALPGIFDAMKDERVQRFLQKQATHVAEVELSPILEPLGDALTRGGRAQTMLDRLIEEAGAMLSEKEPAIRAQVRDTTSWLGRRIGTDERLAEQIVTVLRQALDDIAQDRKHPMRKRFDAAVREFISGLSSAAPMSDRGGTANSTWLRSFLQEVWQQAMEASRRDIANPDSVIRERMQDFLLEAAVRLRCEEAFLQRANVWLRELVQAAIESHRRELSQLITDTVRGWDAATVVAKLEEQVGADLQYVRINGTLIGGLAGLVLHTASVLLS